MMDHDCDEESATAGLEISSVYTDYIAFSDEGVEHPGKLWETKSLSYARPPIPVLKLQKKFSSLSNAQIDAVKLSLKSMENILPDGSRQGFYLGDGAGVGKGCTIAAIFGELSTQGQKRGVWVSCSNTLFDAAVRDMYTVGLQIPMLNLADFKADENIDQDGILFVTYSMLVSCSNSNDYRLDQVLHFLSSSVEQRAFDGLVAFDESHKGKHYSTGEKSTKTGDAVVELQARLPMARILYSSATALSEIDNIGYLCRLGLFGVGTSYDTSANLIASLKARGVSSMELLSVELKKRGVFISRVLSMEGITFRIKYCEKDLSILYDKCAKLWNLLYHLMNPDQKLHARYWAYHQRFFSSLILASKIHDAVKITKNAMKQGKSVVIGLQETGEARYNSVKLEDIRFSTTKEILIKAAQELCDINLKKRTYSLSDLNLTETDSDPMNNWNQHLNHDWKTHRQNVLDLYKEIAFSLPQNPIDDLIYKLGKTGKVAELTGRRSRQIRTPSGFIIERRNPKIDNEEDRKAFMLGHKQIAIISDACSTGISLHDEKNKSNNMGKSIRQRVHLTLQYSWSADKVVQQLGRTHRSNSASNPLYIMLFTKIPSEQRFISAACQKLKTLGALTQGERRASQLDETLNSGNNYDYWKEGIQSVCKYVLSNEDPEECEPLLCAFKCVKLVYIHKGIWKIYSVLKEVSKFLNRVMALPTSVQMTILDMVSEHVQNIIQGQRESKRLDEGVKDVVFGIGSKTKIIEDKIFNIKNRTVQLMNIEVDRSLKWKIVEGLLQKSTKKRCFFKKAGRPILAFEEKTGHINEFSIYRPNNCVKAIVPDFVINGETISKQEAKPLWQAQYKKMEDGRCLHKLTKPHCPYDNCVYGNSKYMICILFGCTLNIYDDIYKLCDLNNEHFSVARFMIKENKIIGIIIPQEFYTEVQIYLDNMSDSH